MTAFIYLSIICSVFVTVALLLKRLTFKNKLKKIKPKILKIILGTLLAISVFIIIGLIFLVFIKQPENHTTIGLILVVNIILLFSIILKITDFLDSYREKCEESYCIDIATNNYILFVILFAIILVAAL